MLTEIFSYGELASFGAVLPSLPAESGLAKTVLSLSKAGVCDIFEALSDIYLDYESGMTALILFGENRERTFYLDRTVRLFRGVRFALVPLGEKSSCIILSSENGFTKAGVYESPPATPGENALGGLSLITFFRQQGTRHFYFRGEAHEPYELVFVSLGSMHCITRGTDCRLDAHQCIIIGKNEWHIQYSERPVEFFTLSFSLDGVLPESILDRVLSLSPFALSLMEKAAHERDLVPPDEEYTKSLIKLLLFELIGEKRATSPGAKTPATVKSENDIVARALIYIQKHICEKILLPELAKELHISVAYLFRLFADHLGMPPGEYIAKVKIEECKLLLLSGRHSCGEIAKMMGYSCIQHFSRQFRAVCGVSPTEYARSVR